LFDFKMVQQSIESSGYTAIDLTEIVKETVHSCRLREGLVTVYSPEEHVIITLIEYEPNLLGDLEEFIKKYSERQEPVLEALLGKSVTVPVVDGRLDLGAFKNIVMVDLSRKKGLKRVYFALEGLYG